MQVNCHKVYYISELQIMISCNGLGHFLLRWCTVVHHDLFKLNFPSNFLGQQIFCFSSLVIVKNFRGFHRTNYELVGIVGH